MSKTESEFIASFDPANVPESEYDPVPKGRYTVVIEKADYTDNKAGTGHYVNMKLRIVSNKHTGRYIFDIVNVDHPSEDAQNIGLRRWADYVKFSGVVDLNAVSDIAECGGSFDVLVDVVQGKGVDKDGEPYSPRTVVKKVKPSEEQKAQAQVEQATGATEDDDIPF